jgi:NADH-quinone oxidoreductase subunit E
VAKKFTKVINIICLGVNVIMSMEQIDKIIDKYESKKGFLIQLLLDVQKELKWIPKKAINRISQRLNIPCSQIFRIASFYTVLSLEPIGRHLVRVCEGTACYVRGGPRILDFLESKLEIKSGETTKDNKFTLETVNCLGCCALGPVIEIDKKYFGKLNSLTIEKLLATYD